MLPLAPLFTFFATVLATTSSIVYTDLPCKFSLAAWNVTRHNANSTGAPLVLGQDGATDGAGYELTSTYASYPYNVYPTMSLSNGSLRAYRASGAWLTNATAPTSGGLLAWYTSALFDHDAARVYSVVQYHDPERLPVLAAYGVHNRWSLCPLIGVRGQTSVVFDVSADRDGGLGTGSTELGFDPRACWKVKIQLVPVAGEC